MSTILYSSHIWGIGNLSEWYLEHLNLRSQSLHHLQWVRSVNNVLTHLKTIDIAEMDSVQNEAKWKAYIFDRLPFGPTSFYRTVTVWVEYLDSSPAIEIHPGFTVKEYPAKRSISIHFKTSVLVGSHCITSSCNISLTIFFALHDSSPNLRFERHSRQRVTIKMLMMNDVNEMIWMKEEVVKSEG